MVAQLLITWKPDGYIRWLRGLGQQYTDRRDHFVDLLNAKFHIQTSASEHDFWKGCTVYDAYPKAGGLNEKYGSLGQTKHFSFVAPSAGMFMWVSASRVPPVIQVNPLQIKFYFDSHPEFGTKSAGTLEMRLWKELAKGGVILAPGWFFSADQETIPDGKYEGHYRIALCTATVRVRLGFGAEIA